MEFSINTKGPDEVFILEGIPSDLISFALNGATGHHAYGPFGQMVFQQMAGEGFAIWYSNYFITNDTSFTARADEPVLELHFIFSNPVDYFLEGIGKSSLLNGHFNITYTPFIQSKVSLRGGMHFYTFDIHFDFSFLQKFAGGSTELSWFLDEINSGTPDNITPHSHFATAAMMAVINSILKNKYRGEYQRFFIQSQVIILLIMVLEKIAKDEIDTDSIKLRSTDVERIYAAKDYLIRNMDNPVSIIRMAHIIGINDFKLKKGFKQIFGTTIFHYLENVRLEKAMILVTDTDESIAAIGFTLGYIYPTHFSAVFKRKFGHSPGYFRK